MSAPQGPNPPHGSPPGNPGDQPAWGQHPPGGWGQQPQDGRTGGDPEDTRAVPTGPETRAVPTQGPGNEPPPQPGQFAGPHKQYTETVPGMPAQHAETMPGMAPYGQPPQPGVAPFGQPHPGQQPFGQPQQFGQPPYGRSQQGPQQPYGSPQPGAPQQFGSTGWGQQQPTQQWAGQQQWGQGRPPAAPAGKSGVKSLLVPIGGGVVVVAVIAVLGFVWPGFFVSTVFDQVALQDGIQRVLTQNYNLDVSAVQCDQGINVAEGTSFECQATVDGAPVKVPITITSSDGAYEVGRPA